ncbi:MAG: ATP-binding protein [Butyrivibrio sp.]|nr:ATP-binding protein [Butyrivibrio sp.]
MVGKYDIKIYDNKVHYHLVVKRNITIIQGNSGTGKTTLIDMLLDYSQLGKNSGVTVVCDRKCVAFRFQNEMQLQILQSMHGYIIFLDENNSFIKTHEFARIVNESDNYFVIICRDALPQLPYSIEEIYGMRTDKESQKYIEPKKTYNELYRIYNLENNDEIKPDVVITEDSNSGHECFSKIFTCGCISAEGKSKITNTISKYKNTDKDMLVIVDGAAFGSEMQLFDRKAANFVNKCALYAPESFEYLLLNSGIVGADKDVLENTYDYADSRYYSSWERFYTAYLVEKTKDTVLHYTKSKLNEAYLSQGNLEKIKAQLPKRIEVE